MDDISGGETATDTSVTDTGDSGGTEDSGFDVETASADLASDLFPESRSAESEVDTDTTTEPEPQEAASEVKPPRNAPKSWSKEMHEHYGKLDPVVQDYIDQREQSMFSGIEQYKEFNEFGKQMRAAIAPYEQMIQAEGYDAPKAVQALLNAHKLLRTSAPADKVQYLAQLARSYGIDIGQKAAEQPQIDPTVKALMQKVSNLEGTLTKRQQAEQQEIYKKITTDVESFASDKAHPYFDEVADDIVTLLKTGLELKDAYEKAVWANPVTRQKEIDRINKVNESERAKKAREEAAAAKAATVANIRNRDTRRTPTETNRATMRNLDDALRETQREIKSRSH